jgi:hypothetical protein
MSNCVHLGDLRTYYEEDGQSLPGAGHGSLDARIVIDFLTEREEAA